MSTTGTPLWNNIYDTFYPAGTRSRDILERHSRSVASLALEINSRLRLGLDPEQVEAAAMLHDIGIFLTDAPSIDCRGGQRYIRHGILGADLLRRRGYPEYVARVAERHTGTGLTPADAERMNLPVAPGRSLMPETLLEKLVCYADKFYSKSKNMDRKPLDRVRKSLSKFSPEAIERFEQLHALFSE